jgi:hypothetical protein
VEELHNWIPVLSKVVQILNTYGKKLPNYLNLSILEECEEDLDIVLKALRFLGQLIRAGRDKRCFLSFQVLFIYYYLYYIFLILKLIIIFNRR